MNWTGLGGGLVMMALTAGLPGAVLQMSHDPDMAQHHPMGFDDTRTTHRFTLSARGGTIEVRVKDPKDTKLRDQVVAHLRMIAGQFGQGDFQAPFAVHGEDPAGVPEMKRLHARISYTFVPGATGGRVVISTASKEALAAVHDFLRYQIREHAQP